MWSQLRPGIRINLFFTLLLGVIYPLVMTGICQVLFPHHANGSLVIAGGKVIGSELLGQNFTRPEYFHPRPSAAGDHGYDATASGGSNYGPTNRRLVERVSASLKQFQEENPDYQGPIPADLLTTSASGLDPHISPASAEAQAQRVAGARKIPLAQIRLLIAKFTEPPQFGLLGDARVNVLKVNLALDRDFPKR